MTLAVGRRVSTPSSTTRVATAKAACGVNGKRAEYHRRASKKRLRPTSSSTSSRSSSEAARMVVRRHAAMRPLSALHQRASERSDWASKAPSAGPTRAGNSVSTMWPTG